MRKALLMLLFLIGGLILIACDNTGQIEEELPQVTGILLANASGQGTATDPFVFTVLVDENVEAQITVAPSTVVRDLKFTLVKPEGNGFVPLSSSDTPGLSFNSNNSSQTFSVKALTEGTHYVRVSQGEFSVYVRISVEVDETVDLLPPIDFEENLKVLAIGNSFSDDGMQYVYQIADDYGVENIVLGNLYIGGAELSLHNTNAKEDNAAYAYRKNTTGSWQTTADQTLLDGLLDEDWDIITIQQASGKSGRPDFYEPHLTELLAFIEANKTNENARIMWHMTWAYQANSSHSEFPFYDSNQMTMYNAIVSTYKSEVEVHDNVKGLIPAGTAIQNVRTSFIGDSVTHDGYHLNSSVGRFTAGMTWFRAITGLSIENITYRPAGVTQNHLEAIIESVNHAVDKPFEVTNSSYPDEQTPEPGDETYPLIGQFVIGYWFPSTHNINQNANNHINFVATSRRYSKDELPVGSFFDIAEGYQYRLVFFKNLDGDLADNYRTDNNRVKITVDESFWGEYEFVGINVSPITTTDVTQIIAEVASKLTIEVPYEASNHIDEDLYFVSGYWSDGATRITTGEDAFTKGFLASNVLSKEAMPVDTVITIASGYQIRISFLTHSIKDGYKVIKRSVNYSGTVTLTEDLYEAFKYMTINISATPSRDLSGEAENAAENVLSFELFVDIPHVDEALSFVSGYWFDNQSQVNNTAGNSPLFIASNIFSKDALPVGTEVVIEEGHQIRVIFFSYIDNVYTVLKRSDNLTGTVVLDETLWESYEYIGFNLSTLPTRDISAEIETVGLALTINLPEEEGEPHVDEDLFFVSGYWADNATQITTGEDAFTKGFIASNVLSKEAMPVNTVIEVASGYQIRISFLTYSSQTGYKVIKRSVNFSGSVTLTEEMYEQFGYMTINISATPSRDLSAEAATAAAELLSFSTYEPIQHVDEPLSFVSGYWFDNQSQVNSTAGNSPLFIASNIFSKDALPVGTQVVVEAGHQIRVVFFSYVNNVYTVLHRSDNLTGTILLDETLWASYEYVGFNLSTVPNRNISEEIETVGLALSWILPEENPE